MKQLCPETSHLPSPGLRSKALDDSWFIRAATRLFVERDLNSRSVSRTTVNDRHESFSVAAALIGAGPGSRSRRGQGVMAGARETAAPGPPNDISPARFARVRRPDWRHHVCWCAESGVSQGLGALIPSFIILL